MCSNNEVGNHPKQITVAATNTTVAANENFRVKIADPKFLGRETTSTNTHFSKLSVCSGYQKFSVNQPREKN
jgi:hypothetical protein